jgi:hypothetical protein
MSENGQKILFDHLEKFYKSLTDAEKAQFDDGTPAPCVKDLIKAKRIYFYKFLDQYLCFRSGPRSISLKAGKSANILGGASLAGTLAKTHAGGQGAFTAEELPKVLKHLGLTDYLEADKNGKLPEDKKKQRPHFVVCKNGSRGYMDGVPKFRPKTYSLMCCSIAIGNSKASNATQHRFHAISGFVCDGKGYLFDSNQRKPFPCNWWDWRDLKRVVNNEVALAYDFFAGGQINYMSYNYVMFSNNSYTDGIKPTCKLKYKKTKTPLLAASNYNRKNFNNYIKVFKPAQQAALKRARARRMKDPILNKAFFNSVLESAKSMLEGHRQVSNLRNAGYRIDHNAYNKFINQLNAKFASPKKRSTSPTSPKYSPVNNPNPRSPSPVNNQGEFYYAKQRMAQEKTMTGRGRVYSEVWKRLPVYQRKVLAHFRNHGKWLPKNHFKKSSPLLKGPIKRKPKSPNLPMPIPLNSPRTTRRKNIETGFNAYWKELNKNNRNTVRNYIASHKSPSPAKPKSPSPEPSYRNLLNYAKNINALKTAKARAEWLKAKKPVLPRYQIDSLKQYIKTKNQANKNRRAAKKNLKK